MTRDWTDYKAWVMHPKKRKEKKKVAGHLIAQKHSYLFSHKSNITSFMLIGNGDEKSTAITSFIIEGKKRDTAIALKEAQNILTK